MRVLIGSFEVTATIADAEHQLRSSAGFWSGSSGGHWISCAFAHSFLLCHLHWASPVPSFLSCFLQKLSTLHLNTPAASPLGVYSPLIWFYLRGADLGKDIHDPLQFTPHSSLSHFWPLYRLSMLRTGLTVRSTVPSQFPPLGLCPDIYLLRYLLASACACCFASPSTY